MPQRYFDSRHSSRPSGRGESALPRVAHNCLLLAIVGTNVPDNTIPRPLPLDAILLMHLHLPSWRKETFAGPTVPGPLGVLIRTRVVQANHLIISDCLHPVNAAFALFSVVILSGGGPCRRSRRTPFPANILLGSAALQRRVPHLFKGLSSLAPPLF